MQLQLSPDDDATRYSDFHIVHYVPWEQEYTFICTYIRGFSNKNTPGRIIDVHALDCDFF